MGIDRYLLASTLNLVIAQRLIKKICDHCKEPVQLDQQIFDRLKIDSETAATLQFYEGKGCSVCGNTGYFGRLPIFEFLILSPEIRTAIIDGKSESRIKELSRMNKYGSLLDSGIIRLKQGVTTAEEVLNTTFAEDIS